MVVARNLISIFILTIFMGVGFLAIGTVQSTAQDICTLTIEKVANPANDAEFDFEVTGVQENDFTLSDPSDPSETFGVEQGTITVTELLPPGWDLSGIECVQGIEDCGGPGVFVPCLELTVNVETNSITAVCQDDDTGSCTFTNVASPRNIPTMSQWGMIGLALLLIVVGIWAITRKKATA